MHKIKIKCVLFVWNYMIKNDHDQRSTLFSVVYSVVKAKSVDQVQPQFYTRCHYLHTKILVLYCLNFIIY